MIKRELEKELLLLVQEYPVVTILGPRQAGKTTLARLALPEYAYANLEEPETREFAQQDPKAFLAQFSTPVIIDEIQRVPLLLSYIQVRVDEQQQNGFFVLTGSHQLQLREAVSQSLAGRTALLQLLPLSLEELNKSNIKLESFADYCYTGFLPRIYQQKMRPGTAHANYYQTYVERDVRLLINLKDMTVFEKFLKLMAGRVGQVVSYSALANDVGVDQKTIKHWLSILEASFILYKLPAYFENFGKRVIKSPKYYFIDVGLLCFLLGIKKSEQVSRDPLVGSIFENLIVIECLKACYNRGEMANLYYFRDSNGNEVDVVFQQGRELLAIEIKSAATFSMKQLKGLKTFANISQQVASSWLVYTGEHKVLGDDTQAVHYDDVASIFRIDKTG